MIRNFSYVGYMKNKIYLHNKFCFDLQDVIYALKLTNYKHIDILKMQILSNRAFFSVNF